MLASPRQHCFVPFSAMVVWPMTVFWWLSTSRVEFFGGVGKISTGSTLNLKVARCAGAWDSRGVASSRSYLNNILVKEWCLRICCCWNIAKDFVRGNLGGTWLSLCLYGRALNVRLGLDVPAMPTVMCNGGVVRFCFSEIPLSFAFFTLFFGDGNTSAAWDWGLECSIALWSAC